MPSGGSSSVPNVPANVPPHLRRFVVEQDYAQYTAVDQAVWRFVLLQMYARLVDSAHRTYRDGLGSTGMSVDRIPSIAEMNDKLARFGWGAVCVDGFIPPRAFQEFQACGILPIAAEIRTREHLPYTPAPDIIHEAAGHAPILPEPVFAAYVRHIGALGAKAFTVPEEERVFQAVYALSEVKESPAATAEEVAGAAAELKAAVAAVPEVSEAALLSRLYWWTAEYGLFGTVKDYKIYGAGLLSSLGESHSCHSPGVRKLPLDEDCVDVSYDITQPQPQLFVTPSFEALHEVLDRVVKARGIGAGGAVGLGRVVRSRELGSVGFSSGGWVMGVLRDMGPDATAPAWLGFDGPVAFAWDGAMQAEQAHLRRSRIDAEPRLIVTGLLSGGVAFERLSDADIGARRDRGSGRHRFDYASGAVVEGRLDRRVRHRDGRLMHIELNNARVTLPGREPVALEHYVAFAAGDVTAVQAGAVDARFHIDGADSGGPLVRVPRPRRFSAVEQRLINLYEQAERAARQEGPLPLAHRFAEVYQELGRDYPDEWLLRWNLLESMLKANEHGELTRALGSELERLEEKLDRRQPIASGLRYLREHRRRRATTRV